MTVTMRWARNLVVALLLGGAAGCATTGITDPRDPLEGFNRAMFSFNEGFDQAIGKPVATAYRDVLPDPVRTWVRNFFANLGDLWIGLNNLLQGKPADTVTDWARFAFNSTLGVFGINDVASSIGLEKHDEDFGQTLGRWGLDDGAYLVWPFLGSSSIRDTVGLIPDSYADLVVRHKPGGVAAAAWLLRATGKRADLLDASRILEEAALDKYVFMRDAYLQRRRSQVYDGNPPRASREMPLADAAAQPQPAQANAAATQAPAEPAPAAAPEPAVQEPSLPHAPSAAVEAAARMLEAPAAAEAGGG
ncbi:MAG TPA: VacJ family lipoprotein [Burkholderiales bacterium]|nr:VacJ family lipoprotein [Burkholderiales bacterium]